ncbi:MAG TPA: sulfite exporter TauE/SafE family protein [Candidatus Aquilonibacter sp.]|nr:sulfite exporter TauE/SafE family protein [Candidatus Aquilonibacter sp.]
MPVAAAFLAGAMNSVAGGGSFLSFPALIFAGIPAIPANATNNAAMWVGTIGGARGYWSDVAPHKKLLYSVLAVSSLGALIGACLLLLTPPATFNRLIPWLLLFATVVFGVSPLLTKKHDGDPEHQSWQLVVQFFVSIYGGYFGAGMGILMLAVLAFSGLPSFNATNGMKNVLSVAINGMALVPFVIARVVDWRFAIPMCVMALLGGYFGAKFFRRIPQRAARAIVITIGVAMTIAFFVRG